MTERLEMINVLRLIKALLAQLVELLFCNQQVGSSNLSEGTKQWGHMYQEGEVPLQGICEEFDSLCLHQ